MASRGRPRLSPASKATFVRKEKHRSYQQTKQNIRVDRDVVARWENCKQANALKTHTDVASFLLDLWDKSPQTSRSVQEEHTPIKQPSFSTARKQLAQAHTESTPVSLSVPGPSFPVSDISESNGCYPAYKARNQIAMLDHQFHKDRPYLLNKDGEPRLHRRYSKRSGTYSCSEERIPKTYAHVKGLLEDILQSVFHKRDFECSSLEVSIRSKETEKDLVQIVTPPTKELQQLKKSRFEEKSTVLTLSTKELMEQMRLRFEKS